MAGRGLLLLQAMRLTLSVPPTPNMVPEGVFDAHGWCASKALHVHLPDAGLSSGADITENNPSGFAFVFHGPTHGLPAEPGELHVPGLLTPGDMILAPYAIDDATDGLYAKRLAPSEVLSLAVTRFDALYWALHDWCHFHNHGPFEQRAWTELQCDITALQWLRQNARGIALQEEQYAHIARQVGALCTKRFEAENIPATSWSELLVW